MERINLGQTVPYNDLEKALVNAADETDLNEQRVIKENLLCELEINGIITARHDSEKVAKIIMGLT